MIGTLAGCLVVFAVLFVEQRLHIDDPVGAIAVHGFNGLFGVLAVGIFPDGTYGDGWNGISGGITGILYGDAGQLLAQAVSCVTIIVFGGGLAYAFFKLTDRLVGIRSAEADEIAGLDLPEMGSHAYPEFVHVEAGGSSTEGSPAHASPIPVRDEARR